MTNKTHTPAHTTQTAEAQPVRYKITIIEHTRSFTGDKFITSSDLCNRDRSLMTFESLGDAERAARRYAGKRGIGYIEIGQITTPRLFESLVEIRIA